MIVSAMMATQGAAMIRGEAVAAPATMASAPRVKKITGLIMIGPLNNKLGQVYDVQVYGVLHQFE